MTQHPRVFVSHASEDKEQFVRGFATRLRDKGIEAWVDEWEIMPGNSLVDKIFEEGIGNAEAMIVVVSDNSVNKPWVREELNAGVVRRINNQSKLIPVIIGEVANDEIPESLKSIVWERIGNVNNYDAELDRIVRAVYEYQEKPPIGDPPAYTQHRIYSLPGLTELDSLILKICCEDLIQNSEASIDIVRPQNIFDQTRPMEVGDQDILESIEILEGEGYLDVSTVMGGGIFSMKVTARGFEDYARNYLSDYDDIYRSVALEIVNRDAKHVKTIAEALEQPEVVVDHIVRELESMGMIKAQEFAGGSLFIHNAHATLKRWLQEQ